MENARWRRLGTTSKRSFKFHGKNVNDSDYDSDYDSDGNQLTWVEKNQRKREEMQDRRNAATSAFDIKLEEWTRKDHNKIPIKKVARWGKNKDPYHCIDATTSKFDSALSMKSYDCEEQLNLPEISKNKANDDDCIAATATVAKILSEGISDENENLPTTSFQQSVSEKHPEDTLNDNDDVDT